MTECQAGAEHHAGTERSMQMTQGESSEAHRQLAEIVTQLRQAAGVVESLPSTERDIAIRALEGATVSEIASAHGISEAAVWSTLANQAGNLTIGEAELDEALNAAAAVGDDAIQSQGGGRVNPDTFTHGTSEQRRSWFLTGYQSGDLDSCNTFG